MSLSLNYPTISPVLNLDFAKTRSLDSRITFTRASTGTYYDTFTSAMAEQNLYTYSQEFDNAAWSKSASSISANSTLAPDGTTTADTLTADGTTATHYMDSSYVTQNVQRTVSIFAAPGTNNFLQIRLGTDAAVYANFNLSTGALGTVAGGTATITASTNGFYRCTLTYTSATSTGVAFNIVTSGTAARNESNSLTTSVIFWGAQLEQRSAVTSYTPTTTQAVTNFVPVLMTAQNNIARFDCNPVTREGLGLEIEEQRTNLLTYSADFSNAAWSKTRASITSNTIVAPDGTLTGDKLVEDTTASNTHFTGQTQNFTAASVYSFSVYAKAAERSVIVLQLPSSAFGTSYSVWFDLAVGTVSKATGTGTSSIVAVGNGWYRCAITATATVTVGAVNYIYLDNSPTGSAIYTGNGYSGAYLWGAQLEAGSFPTSYIPTVASQVTRAADSASMTGTNFSSWFNAAEGSTYSEFSIPITSSGNRGPIRYDDGTENNRMMIRNGGASSNLDGRVIVNGTSTVNLEGAASAITANVFYKACMAYKRNDFAMSVNAGTVLTNTNSVVPVVNRFIIGDPSATGTATGCSIKKITYYTLRLTNAQLQALTS